MWHILGIRASVADQSSRLLPPSWYSWGQGSLVRLLTRMLDKKSSKETWSGHRVSWGGVAVVPSELQHTVSTVTMPIFLRNIVRSWLSDYACMRMEVAMFDHLLTLEVTFKKEGSLRMLAAIQVEDIDVSGISNNNSGCKISVPGKDKVSFVMRIYGDSIKCTGMYKLTSKYCILLPYPNRKTCFQIIKDKNLGATQFSPASSS